jgi:hypothetical protein
MKRNNSPLVIGICGQARSGKDTAAKMFCSMGAGLDGWNLTSYTLSLATPIKRMLIEMLDHMALPHSASSFEYVYSDELKDKPIEELGGKSPRQMMQTLGTDWGRGMVDDELWIKIARHQIDFIASNVVPDHALIVIPDIRFDNEAKLCDYVVKIVNKNKRTQVTEHVSEAGVSKKFIGYTLDNSGTKDHLRKQVLETYASIREQENDAA